MDPCATLSAFGDRSEREQWQRSARRLGEHADPLATASFALGQAPGDPNRRLIEQSVGHGRNAMAIYQDPVTDHEFRGEVALVARGGTPSFNGP
jgi:hypothetical protein